MYKILQKTFFCVTILFLLLACDDNSAILESNLPESYTTDALAKYEVPSEPGSDFSIDFTVEVPDDCKIESNQEWCRVISNTDDKGIHISLKIEDNVGSTDRTAKVTISSPKIKGNYVVEIRQMGLLLEIGNLEKELAPEGKEYALQVSSNSKWTLETDVDWIELNVTSGEATASEPTVVKAVVKSNDTGIVRSANVTLRSVAGKELVYTLTQCEPWKTEVRVGDAGLQFDESRFDTNYPLYSQMQAWKTAGKAGGIPSLENVLNTVSKTFEPGTSIDEIKAYLDGSDKYAKRTIFLKNGEYIVTKPMRLYSNDVLIGESKEGVILKMSGNGQVSLYNGNNVGLRNVTIKGQWADGEPDPTLFEETLSDASKATHKTIDMCGTKNSYVDNVAIINAASHPIVIGATSQGTGNHNTIRDVVIDGAYNKAGGYQGYFHIGGAYNLITGCKVTRIRHISFQDPVSEYNVFYKNDVTQEISFHNNDGGNNLVEYNKITTPVTLHDGYCSIMGPWSVQHQVGGKNFIYRNKCLELNQGGKVPWSDDELYIGPWEVKPADLYTQFRAQDEYPKPTGGTLYPVILK